MINKILESPFDEERDFFVNLCKTHVPYLAKVSDRDLKLFYHRSAETFYNCGELLFGLCEPTDFFYVVMEGVISIELTDGYKDHILDLLGRGSLIQTHNVIFDELAAY